MPRRRKSVASLTPDAVITEALRNVQKQTKNLTQAGSASIQLVDKQYYLNPTEGEIIFDYPRKLICVWHDGEWWCAGNMRWKKFRQVSAGTATGYVISSTPCYYGGHYVDNSELTAFRFVHLYDKSTAPIAGDTPAMTIAIPPSSGANQEYSGGVEFTNGLSMAFSSGRSSGISGVTANTMVATILYNNDI